MVCRWAASSLRLIFRNRGCWRRRRRWRQRWAPGVRGRAGSAREAARVTERATDRSTGAPDQELLARYEMVVGLEVHVQLKTRTKAFCSCSAQYGAPPNTMVCPVCLALPGALPVLNAHAVELAIRAAVALGCTVHPASIFARKHYFYPDLPKGYQISQYDRPLATAGTLSIGDRPIRITRVHLEEDAGKSIHDRFRGASAI